MSDPRDFVRYELRFDESSRYGWAIVRVSFSGWSTVDSRRWDISDIGAASEALMEYRAQIEATTCPSCGSKSLRVVRSGFFVECDHEGCFWTQTPDNDLVIAAAIDTYKRNQATEAA